MSEWTGWDERVGWRGERVKERDARVGRGAAREGEHAFGARARETGR